MVLSGGCLHLAYGRAVQEATNSYTRVFRRMSVEFELILFGECFCDSVITDRLDVKRFSQDLPDRLKWLPLPLLLTMSDVPDEMG